MMKTLQNIFTVLLLSFVTSPLLAVDYYYDDFNGTNGLCSSATDADEWCMDFPLSRHGMMYVGYDNDGCENGAYNNQTDCQNAGFTWQATAVTGGGLGVNTPFEHAHFVRSGDAYSNGSVLRIQGLGNNSDLGYNNYWTAKNARFEKRYNATTQKPFGFQVIRYYALSDPSSTAYMDDIAQTVWLVESGPTEVTSTIPSATCTYMGDDSCDFEQYDFESAANYLFFYEKNESGSGSSWGYYFGSEQPKDLNNNYEAFDGTTANLSALKVAGTTNTRKIGIRMTHNGSTVYMYLNPDPEDDYAEENQWYLIAQKDVPFNANMKVMLGHEHLYYNTDNADARYDHFLVRPVADSSTVQMTPRSVIAGTATEFETKITPTMRADDAGVGEIYLKKPSNFGNWDFTNIKVCQDPDNSNTGSACNGTGETLLTAENASASAEENDNPSAGRLSVATLEAADNTGDTLIIRFRKTSSGDNNIFHSTNAGANLRVYATLTASAPDATGGTFEAWLQNEKYSDTAQEYVLDNTNGLRYATTYRMKASPASTAITTVNAYSQPEANMAVSVSPDPLFWGENTPFVTLELRTDPTSDGPDITQLVVDLPDEPNPPGASEARFEFELNDGTEDVALVDSLKIPSAQEGTSNYQTYSAADNSSCAATYCYNSQTRQLVINYGTSYKVPGRNGFDRITFYAKKAPLFDASDQLVTNWSASVNSTGFISGTTAQAVTAYNADATNLQTIVRATPPVTIGSITPNILSNNVGNANPTTSKVTYSIKNQGSTANKVRRVELLVPYETYNSVAGDPGHPFSRENFGTINAATDLTNIQVDGGAPSFTPTVSDEGTENISGTDYRVIRIDFGGTATDTLNSGETLSFDIDLDYYRNTNSAAKAYEIKHRADNMNYSVSPGYPYPQYTDGGENPSESWSVTLTPPDPRGEAFVYRGVDESSTAEVYTNEISSGNVTDVKMKIINLGGIGNNINNAVIEIPDFLTVTETCSSYLGQCVGGGNININDAAKEITIDYAGATNALRSNQDTGNPVEVLTFTIQQDTTFSVTGTDDYCEITDPDSNGIFESFSCQTDDSNSTIRKGSFYAKLNNASTEDSYTRVATGKSLDILFKHPLPVAQAYYTTDLAATYEVDATRPSTTAKLYLKNTASLAGNKIYQFDIQFPTTTTIVTGTPSISSISRDSFTSGGGSSISSLTEGTHYNQSWDAGTQKLTVTYTSGNELDISGEAASGTDEDNNFFVDIIDFSFNDTVIGSTVKSIPVVVYNRVGVTDTGNSVNAGTFYKEHETNDIYNTDSDDLSLFYSIPPSEGTASVSPKTVYTSGIAETVESKFYIQNKADSGGTNIIYKVQIDLPAGTSVAAATDITARGGAGTGVTCSGGDGFAGGGCSGSDSEKIEIDYSGFTPAGLHPGNDPDDEILMKWSHTQSTLATKVFQVSFDNNDGSGFSNLETVPASLLTVEFVPQPQFKIEVLERTGDATNPKSKIDNQTIATTVPDNQYHRFKITVSQDTSGSSRIHQLKIPVPAPFDASSLDKVDMLPNGTDISVSGSDLLVTFPGNYLNSASTALEFRLQENRDFNVPGTHNNTDNITWQAQADYFDDILTNATYTNNALPGPEFAGKITADGNDDEIIYTPSNDFATAKAINPVSGTGEAGQNWNIIALENPVSDFTIYTSPKSVFRVNATDPDYVFTNQIIIRNTSETNNDIRIVEVTPPAGFLTALAGADLSNVVVKKGTTGTDTSGFATLTQDTEYTIINTTDSDKTYDVSTPETIRIKIIDETKKLVTGESLVIEFSAAHHQTTTGSHNWVLKAGNYNETVTLTTGNDPAAISQQWATDIVTPSYTANFILGSNSIVATSKQNTLTGTVTNESTGGDNLVKLKIALPGYFNVNTAVVNSTLGTVDSRNNSSTDYDTTGLSAPVILADEETTFNKDNYIVIDYGSGLTPGQSDTISITIEDSFFDSTSLTITDRDDEDGKIARLGNDAITVKASAEYDTSSGSFNYITSFPEGSNRVEITQPEPQATAWLNTYAVTLEDESTGSKNAPRNHTISLNVQNTADASTGNHVDNVIYRAKVRFPENFDGADIVNSITNLASTKGAAFGSSPYDNAVGVNSPGTEEEFIIYLDYESTGGLKPGEADEITFTMNESGSGSYANVEVAVDNHSAVDGSGAPDATAYIADSNIYPQGTEIDSGNDATKTLRLTLIAPDDPSEGYVKYFADPAVIDVSRQSDREILSSYGDDGKFTVYLIGNEAQITYQVTNGSKNYTLEQARIALSQLYVSPGPGNMWDNASVASVYSHTLDQQIDVGTIQGEDLYDDTGAAGSGGAQETKHITIDYTSLLNGGLAPGKTDTVTITLDVSGLSSLVGDDSNTYNYYPDGCIINCVDSEGVAAADKTPAVNKTSNFVIYTSAAMKHAGLGVFKAATNGYNPAYLYLRKAQFSRISGNLIGPAGDSFNPGSLTVEVIDANGNVINQFGTSNPLPSVIPRVSQNSDATFAIDRVPVGNNYVVRVKSSDNKYMAQDYIITDADKKANKEYSVFTATANQITNVTAVEYIHNQKYEVRYKQLSQETGGTVYAPLDGVTKIVIPPGALDNSPRVNIRIEETASQIYGVLDDKLKQMQQFGSHGVANTSTHRVYNLVNELTETGKMVPVTENQLNEPATMTLGYQDTLLTDNNWQESELRIYYWEYTRQRWVPVGGKVDAGNNTITADIDYMHRTYTILPATTGEGPISNVDVFPRAFTPGRKDSHYINDPNTAGNYRTFGNLKITFELESAENYVVAIYSLRGNKVREWARTTSYNQGSVYWDGRDESGNYVRGGIYVYVIQAGGAKYRGTFLVAR